MKKCGGRALTSWNWAASTPAAHTHTHTHTHTRSHAHTCAGDKAHGEMRGACFDYLALGGIYSSGPVSLLSGLNPRPSVLVMHFFMVRACVLPAALACNVSLLSLLASSVSLSSGLNPRPSVLVMHFFMVCACVRAASRFS